MTPAFSFVDVPARLRDVVGAPDPGTRIYRIEGPEGGSGPWFEAINAIAGQLVSPGGVSMFAPVSRAAVHKRLKEGRLTAFCYHPTSSKTGLFGRRKLVRGTPFVYVPVSECKGWAEEFKERMLRLGQITQEELEGDVPDWSGDFWQWESKWRRMKLEQEAERQRQEEERRQLED